MIELRFIGDPKANGEGPPVIVIGGLTFVRGQWVDVDSSPVVDRLTKNSHFEVRGKKRSGEVIRLDIPDDWDKTGKGQALKRIRIAKQISPELAELIKTDADAIGIIRDYVNGNNAH